MRRQAKLESARDDPIMITRYETGAPDMPATLRRCASVGGESTGRIDGRPGHPSIEGCLASSAQCAVRAT